MIDLPPSVEVIEGHDFAGSTEAVRHALFDVATKGMGILDNIATSRQLLEMFSNFSDIRRKKYSVKLLQASEEVPDNVKQLAAMIDSFMTIEATDHEFVRRQPDSGLGWHLDNSLITPGFRLLAHLKLRVNLLHCWRQKRTMAIEIL